jgi:transketolase
MYFIRFIILFLLLFRGEVSMDNALQRAADNVRILSAAMVEKAKSGHPGGAMGGADFVSVLYSEFLVYDPNDMHWPHRDRFFLDPGHMSAMLYSILTLCGHYSLDDLKQFRQWGSHTPGHPELDVAHGVENTSGPLGQGHTFALGAAIAERFLAARFGEWLTHKTYAYISDGGIQEEISQATGRLAGHLGLSNLIMFYDSNDIQLSTETKAVTGEDTARKYESWGWRVETIDGHDIGGIRAALKRAVDEKQKPSLIIGKTIMGKGARTEAGESFERKVSTHGQPLSKAGASLAATVRALGGDPENPFAIFSDVKELFGKARENRIRLAAERKRQQAAWEAKNPEAAAKLEKFFANQVPEIDYSAIEQKPNIATRAASGAVLALCAKKVENMVVASADLSDSDMTHSFLKATKPFTKGDFSGAFLQIGVSELTMAAIMNGMALHGGVIPVCGTFFAFSDYMKPAVRLAAIMGLPVKYIWTHDAFRVGEDGPTHQPIEQEAQIRLLEKMKNLSGKRSMLVLRPADAAETTVAWKIALENTSGPTALILSRQGIADLPAVGGSTRFAAALQAGRGAYVVADHAEKPELVLVANGSEVATLVNVAAKLLNDRKMKVRVVSAPSEALFLEQPAAYQESVIPFGVPVFGLSAGLPLTLQGLTGPLGKTAGMQRFGASAPYEVLDEKFGYTVDAIAKQIETYLQDYTALVRRIQKIAVV